MSKTKTKYKVKNIYMNDIHGELKNYGKLVVGCIDGMKCLAPKETLLLLGIKLSSGKQIKTFHNTEKIQVKVAGNWFTVYSALAQTTDRICSHLTRQRLPVRKVADHDPEIILATWSRTGIKEEKEVEEPVDFSNVYKGHKVWKKPSFFKSLWFKIKNIFK